jgi:hypothetical protein
VVGVVTATGSHTTMGELSLLLAKSDADSKLTTLHLEVNHFVRIGTPTQTRKPPTVAPLTCLSYRACNTSPHPKP